MKKPKIALVHEFLEQYGGAEKTLEAISEIFPDAPIYTAKYNKSNLSEYLKNKKVIYPKKKVNILGKLSFLFRMPLIFESFDFSEYDIVISDGTTWNKGILTTPEQLHVTYIHTPPRFLYGYSQESTKWQKWYLKPFYTYLINFIRLWDFIAAQRPDHILANSNEVKKRINKFYSRESTVINPPVEVTYGIDKNIKVPEEPYFIAIGRLSAYKNFDLLIRAFNKTNHKLVIVGTGLEEQKLKNIAEKNIIFKGRTSDVEKHTLLEGALGLINAVDDEDFGIVPVEAMAHGIPVLAHRSGGHLETVEENKTGMFFEELNAEHLKEKIETFDEAIKSSMFNKQEIKKEAQKFSKEVFKAEFEKFVFGRWEALQENA